MGRVLGFRVVGASQQRKRGQCRGCFVFLSSDSPASIQPTSSIHLGPSINYRQEKLALASRPLLLPRPFGVPVDFAAEFLAVLGDDALRPFEDGLEAIRPPWTRPGDFGLVVGVSGTPASSRSATSGSRRGKHGSLMTMVVMSSR